MDLIWNSITLGPFPTQMRDPNSGSKSLSKPPSLLFSDVSKRHHKDYQLLDSDDIHHMLDSLTNKLGVNTLLEDNNEQPVILEGLDGPYCSARLVHLYPWQCWHRHDAPLLLPHFGHWQRRIYLGTDELRMHERQLATLVDCTKQALGVGHCL